MTKKFDAIFESIMAGEAISEEGLESGSKTEVAIPADLKDCGTVTITFADGTKLSNVGVVDGKASVPTEYADKGVKSVVASNGKDNTEPVKSLGDNDKDRSLPKDQPDYKGKEQLKSEPNKQYPG